MSCFPIAKLSAFGSTPATFGRQLESCDTTTSAIMSENEADKSEVGAHENLNREGETRMKKKEREKVMRKGGGLELEYVRWRRNVYSECRGSEMNRGVEHHSRKPALT